MDILARIAQAFAHGGFWMMPIAAFQAASLAIIFERVFALFIRRGPDQLDFVKTFEGSIRRGEMETVIAKATATAHSHPISMAVQAGAQAAIGFGGKEEIQGKMDEVLLRENSQLEKRIGYLAMLGNVATLTGLLGTITGMIQSFSAVAEANPAEKASVLSLGISQAMNCTAYGLVVAIPALVAYAILQGRAATLTEDINQAGLKAYNWLSYTYNPVMNIPIKPKRTSNADRSF